jgi:hypothetical protein
VENVPKIVRVRLQRAALPTAEPHPDADLLTAFAEQSLSGSERDHVLQHLALCGDCRNVVAFALPATEPAALTLSRSPGRIGWLSLPVLRWGFVAAGIVLVTSVGILQYRQRHQEKTLVATSLESPGATQNRLTDSAVQSPAPTPPTNASQPPSPQTQMGKQIEMAKKSPSRAQRALAANKPVPSPGPGAIYAQPQPMRRAPSASALGGAGFGFGSSAGQRSRSVGDPLLREPEPAPADQLQIVGKAKPASPQASLALPPAPVLPPHPTLMKGLALPRWTISAGGALQKSFDGGQTWLDVDVSVNDLLSANLGPRGRSGMNTSVTVEASGAALEVQPEVQSEAKSETKSETKSSAKSAARASVKSTQSEPVPAIPIVFRALSVSSNAEVWAGGSGGTLYHTVDAGNHWSRVVPSDTGAILSGDVIRIQFSNPHSGIVTTSTAEVWTTLDAGQTWHKQP